MFKGIINDATSAAHALVVRIAARASIVVPFLIALGFATAAVTVWLIDRYGARDACFIVAGAFVVIGLIAMIVVRSNEYDVAVPEMKATESETAEMASDTVSAAAQQIPLAVIGSLLTLPGGPSSVLSAGRVVVRNWPLVFLLGGIGFLLSAKSKTGSSAGDVGATAADRFRQRPDERDNELRTADVPRDSGMRANGIYREEVRVAG